MKVTLIDFTGVNARNPADYAARLLIYVKNTRLTQGEDLANTVNNMTNTEVIEQLDAISKTIRSSWEFVDYTFQVEGVTRAFTHQFVRTRNGSYAQQAQRVANMGEFETRTPESVETVDGGEHWDALMEEVRDTYQYYQSKGVPNQDCRGVLPTNVLTNIVAKFNLRTMADLVGKRENLRAQDEYAEVVALMKAELLRVHPWADIFLNPERTQTPALEAILRAALGGRSPVDAPEINDALKELDLLKSVWG